MAQFPCDHSGHLFKGRALYFYPAVGRGQNMDRRRYRLCPAHAGDTVMWLYADTDCEQKTDGDDHGGQIICPICHEPVWRDYSYFFCTAFVEVDGDIVRRDFWAAVHDEHLPAVWDRFQEPGQAAETAFPGRMGPVDQGVRLTGSRGA